MFKVGDTITVIDLSGPFPMRHPDYIMGITEQEAFLSGGTYTISVIAPINDKGELIYALEGVHGKHALPLWAIKPKWLSSEDLLEF